MVHLCISAHDHLRVYIIHIYIHTFRYRHTRYTHIIYTYTARQCDVHGWSIGPPSRLASVDIYTYEHLCMCINTRTHVYIYTYHDS